MDRSHVKPLQAPRNAFPETRKIVAQWRQSFPDVRLTYAAEAGLEIGRRGPEGVPASLAHNPPKKRRGYR